MKDKFGRTVVILGAPLSGKTTICEELCHKCGFASFEFGKVLRAIIDKGNGGDRFGYIYDTVKKGVLLDDELAEELFRELVTVSREEDFVTDGYPRTKGAITGFLRFLEETGRSLSGVSVVHILTTDAQIARLAEARGRSDDLAPTVLSSRIRVYEDNTLQTVNELSKHFKLIEVKSGNGIDVLFSEVCDRLGIMRC
jgi:adenylate kinase family enzyme